MEFDSTILVIISLIIVLFLFGISAFIYKRMQDKNRIETIKEEEYISKKQTTSMEEFFKEVVSNFFSKYKYEYSNIDVNVNVANLNKKYTSELEDIIKTDQVKSMIEIKDSRFYKEANFLKEIVKESPFVWEKKFGKEIEEYYG